ncbi:hypothetical protein B0A53_05836 [Rhodotorula sp. CCFEE 5036]|nr:hypothetical protein B0A53_05836 [Rhodotorula sp. CCFEE 5036]
MDFMAVLPNLQHLRVGLEQNPRHRWELFPTVSRLPRLVSLELDTTDISTWLQWPGFPPPDLTLFILSGTRPLYLHQLVIILGSSPVVSLSMREFFMSDLQPRDYSPDDLRIEHLSIAGYRRRASAIIGVKRVKAFIKKHRATLLSFKIDRALLAPSADVSAINRSLEQEGVSVRVVTVK